MLLLFRVVFRLYGDCLVLVVCIGIIIIWLLMVIVLWFEGLVLLCWLGVLWLGFFRCMLWVCSLLMSCLVDNVLFVVIVIVFFGWRLKRG